MNIDGAETLPTYEPAMRNVANITNAFPAVVTTTFAHSYITGTVVRLIVPDTYGMGLANNLVGNITVTGPTTFTIPIDTTTFDAFVAPPAPILERAQVVPIGEINSIIEAATHNTLPR